MASFTDNLKWVTSAGTLSIRGSSYLRVVGTIDGLFAPGTQRGDDGPPIVDADGDELAILPLSSYIIRVPVWITGATRGQRNDNLRALTAAIMADGGLGTLIREIAKGTGSSYDTAQAPGRFITGLTPQIMSPRNGATELQFKQAKGRWSIDSGATYTQF